MQGMPRLIADKRRKRCIVICALLIIAVVVPCAVSSYIGSVNESRRKDGLDALRDLQGCHAWLIDEMDMSKDATALASCLEEVSGQFEKMVVVDQAYVNFIHDTRKAECRAEADAIARQCSEAFAELEELRKNLSAQFLSGTNSIEQMRELASSDAAVEIKKSRDELADRCAALKSACSQESVLSSSYSRFLEECRGRVEQFVEQRQNDNAWQEIKTAHASFVNETNALTRMMAKCNENNSRINDRCKDLMRLPVDGAKSFELVRTRINEVSNKAETVISSGMQTRQNAARLMEEASPRIQSNADKAIKSVERLREMHGDFVDAQSAYALFDSLMAQWKSVHTKIASFCDRIGERLDEIAAAKSALVDELASLSNIDYSEGERIFRICMELFLRVQKLERKCCVLDERIASLATRIEEARTGAQGKLEAFASAVREIEGALPIWGEEQRRLIDAFTSIRHRAMEIRSSVYAVKKGFVNFRDKSGNGALLSLRQRAVEILESLQTIESESLAEFSCSNGVELTAQNHRLEKAQNDLRIAEWQSNGLEEDQRRKLSHGELLRVTYSSSCTESFAARLHKGTRHFDLAVKIPSPGLHLVEICFKKGKRALCATKPAKHNVVMCCDITGVHSRETLTRSWNDGGDIWQGRVSVVGNFAEGLNDINLDLRFTVEGDNGAGGGFSSMKWQYQYDSGWFSTDMKDNFWIEVLVDGVPKEIFWGTPE